MSVAKMKKTSSTQVKTKLIAKIFKQYQVASVVSNDVRLVTMLRIFNESTGENIFNDQCNSLFSALSVLKNRYPQIKLNDVDYIDYTSADFTADNTVVFPAIVMNKLSIASTCWDRGILNLIEFEREGGSLLANDCCVHPKDVKYVGADNACFKSGKDLLDQQGKPDDVFKSYFGTMFVWWDDFCDGGDALFALFENPAKDEISYGFVSGGVS